MNDECAIHGHEPIPESGYYLLCGECWHCFVTENELVSKHNAHCKEAGVPTVTSGKDVHMCPECTHDF